MNSDTSTLFLWPAVTPLAACTAAWVLVPLLGEDWPSSVLRTSLAWPRSCGRTGGGLGEETRVLVWARRSVSQRAVAPGSGDVQEGGAHQVEGLFAEGRHVVRRHAFCLDLW